MTVPIDDYGTYRTPEECAAIEQARERARRRKPVDWPYSAGCGCQVTFFAASEYHTSRMLPGETCEEHTQRDQILARDEFVAKAKAELRKHLFTQGWIFK